jgi:hypothetical protein
MHPRQLRCRSLAYVQYASLAGALLPRRGSSSPWLIV